MNQLNQWADYDNLAPVIERELQAFEALQDELDKDNFDGAYQVLVDLREDIKSQKIQEDLANDAMTNLESTEEEEQEVESGW